MVVNIMTMHALAGGEVQRNVSQVIVFICCFLISLAQDSGSQNICHLVQAFGGGHAVGGEGVDHCIATSRLIPEAVCRLLISIYWKRIKTVGVGKMVGKMDSPNMFRLYNLNLPDKR